jgi:hypothetical protein
VPHRKEFNHKDARGETENSQPPAFGAHFRVAIALTIAGFAASVRCFSIVQDGKNRN